MSGHDEALTGSTGRPFTPEEDTKSFLTREV